MLTKILVPALCGLLLFTLGGICGFLQEARTRDAADMRRALDEGRAFGDAVAEGKKSATDYGEWQRAAEVYFNNWQEAVKHGPDNKLAACVAAPAPAAAPGAAQPPDADGAAAAVRLTGEFVRLYNAAWTGEIAAAGDPGGTAAEVGEAGAAYATPREVLDNTGANARACAADRKRHDQLIDLLDRLERQQDGRD